MFVNRVYNGGLNMDKDFLTVKEFSELAGVSVQSIYKKLGKVNNPIQRYLKVVDGVKYISRTALEVLYNSSPATNVLHEEKKTNEQSSTDRILNILEKQLEEQRRQLQEKDKQIAAQIEQINSLLMRLEESSTIINQQQQLTAMNINKLGKDESYNIDNEITQQTEIKKEEIPITHTERNKGFWKLLFRKE